MPKGWFTARLAFAETVDGHLEMQHKHVAARKRIKKIQLFPTLEIPGVAPKYYMHPEVIWEMPVCGTFRPSPPLHWVLAGPCHGGERRSPLRPLPPRGLPLKRPLSPAPEAQACGPAALPQPLASDRLPPLCLRKIHLAMADLLHAGAGGWGERLGRQGGAPEALLELPSPPTRTPDPAFC